MMYCDIVARDVDCQAVACPSYVREAFSCDKVLLRRQQLGILTPVEKKALAKLAGKDVYGRLKEK